MSTPTDQSKVVVAELSLKIVKIQDIVNKILTDRSIPEGGDIIAFIGPTKAGKSTLINCLMGNSLICKVDDDSEDISIEVAKGCVGGPVIGASGESETSVPTGYSNLPGTSFPMWDFPGFSDNKGTEQEIANAVAYERVLRVQRSIRFVLVVPYDLIKSDNPMQLFKLLSEIALICPNVERNLCIVATKAERGSASLMLKKASRPSFANANAENTKIISKGKYVIERVLEKKHCVDFKAPVMVADEDPFTLPNIEEIAMLIKGLAGSTVSQIPLVISDQAKSEIQQLYILYNHKLTVEINEVCERFENFIQKKIDEVMKAKVGDGELGNSSFRSAIFKAGQKNITKVIENACDCRGFVKEVKDLGFHLPTLSENIDNFLFIENIQNKYKLENNETVEGEKQFFQTIMLTLNAINNKYSILIEQCEIAAAEEKKLDNVHNEQMASEKAENEKQQMILKEEMAKEKAENEKRQEVLNEERAKEREEYEERQVVLNEERKRERKEYEERQMIINKEREKERAENEQRQMVLVEERKKESAENEQRFMTLKEERKQERAENEQRQKDLKKERDIERAETEKRQRVLIEEREKEKAENEKREMIMNERIRTERLENEKLKTHMKEEIKKARADNEKHQMILNEQILKERAANEQRVMMMNEKIEKEKRANEEYKKNTEEQLEKDRLKNEQQKIEMIELKERETLKFKEDLAKFKEQATIDKEGHEQRQRELEEKAHQIDRERDRNEFERQKIVLESQLKESQDRVKALAEEKSRDRAQPGPDPMELLRFMQLMQPATPQPAAAPPTILKVSSSPRHHKHRTHSSRK